MKKRVLCLLMALCLCLCVVLAACNEEPPPAPPVVEQEEQGHVHQTPDTSASVNPDMSNEQIGDDTVRYE